jgi:uncharacterized protein
MNVSKGLKMTDVEDFIQVYSGKPFHFNNPSEDEITIEDIAHTLSLLCRFGGHCKEFYSVADHCIRAAYYAPVGFELEALLHDATESYLVDMPRPIKYSLQGYLDLEKNIDVVVRKKFNLPEVMSPEVKLIDARMLATEKRDLMNPTTKEWHELPDPFEEKIYPRSPQLAERDFLYMYNFFKNQKD